MAAHRAPSSTARLRARLVGYAQGITSGVTVAGVFALLGVW